MNAKKKKERMYLDNSLQVILDDFGHSVSAFDSSKGGSFPHASRDELKRPRGDFLSGRRHAHDHGSAPAFVTRLQGLTHGVNVADALERVVETTVRFFN